MYVSAKQRCGWLVSLDSSNNCMEMFCVISLQFGGQDMSAARKADVLMSGQIRLISENRRSGATDADWYWKQV